MSVLPLWPTGPQLVSSTGRSLNLTQGPVVMGILNATPDSFFPGSRVELNSGLTTALAMARAGAACLDIGGESTRPGSQAVPAHEESRRVLPLIREIRLHSQIFLSLDTRHQSTAEAAHEAGIDLVNDVSALEGDPAMGPWLAETGLAVCLMHMQGQPETMQIQPTYGDVTAEVREFLLRRVDFALACGIKQDRILLDPGIGFGKTLEHNLQLLHDLPRLAELGFPLLLGLSRKGFISQLTGAAVEDRLPGSLAAALTAAFAGALVLRVHDPAETVQALTVARAILNRG